MIIKHHILLQDSKGGFESKFDIVNLTIDTVETTIVIKNLNAISAPLIENVNADSDYYFINEDITNILIPEGLYDTKHNCISNYFINLDFSNNSTKKLMFYNKQMAETAHAELKAALSMSID